MRKLLHSTPWLLVVVLCLTLGLAPFSPQPHLVEKLHMLFRGELVKPIDILDFILHASPFILLVLKLSLAPSKS